jgi:hypothetical protein
MRSRTNSSSRGDNVPLVRRAAVKEPSASAAAGSRPIIPATPRLIRSPWPRSVVGTAANAAEGTIRVNSSSPVFGTTLSGSPEVSPSPHIAGNHRGAIDDPNTSMSIPAKSALAKAHGPAPLPLAGSSPVEDFVTVTFCRAVAPLLRRETRGVRGQFVNATNDRSTAPWRYHSVLRDPSTRGWRTRAEPSRPLGRLSASRVAVKKPSTLEPPSDVDV